MKRYIMRAVIAAALFCVGIIGSAQAQTYCPQSIFGTNGVVPTAGEWWLCLNYLQTSAQQSAVVSTLPNGKIFVGNVLNIPAAVNLTGDGSITNAGVLTINKIGGTVINSVPASGNLVGTTDVETLTNKTISGSANTLTNIANASLVNSATTVNGQVCTLGSACIVTAAATGITVGTTTISGGVSGKVLLDNAGVLGEQTVSSTATASALVLRDANANTFSNNILANAATTAATAGTTVLTASSARYQALTTNASNGQTFQLPDATTLTIGPWFVFNNNSAGSLVINNNGGSAVYTISPGGIEQCGPTNVSTSNGTWDCHGFLPSTVQWGTGTGGLTMNTVLNTTASISSGAASATNPVFIPQRGTLNTGYSGDATHLYGVIGGSTVWTATSTGVNSTAVGATTASTGAFTTLSASSTVSGTGFSTYLASPPAIGGTAANTGAFTTGGFSGNQVNGGNLTLGASASLSTASGLLTVSPSSKTTKFDNSIQIGSSAANPNLNLFDSTLGADLKTWQVIDLSGNYQIYAANDAQSASTLAYSLGRGTTYNIASHTWYISTVAGTALSGMSLTSSGLSVSSGLANSLTLAGSATNPTIGTTSGNMTLAPNGQAIVISGASAPGAIWSNSGAGTDLKNWYLSNSGNFGWAALKDDQSAATSAYVVTRGTTYNVAAHFWYTSTTPGTAVQGLSLDTNNLVVSRAQADQAYSKQTPTTGFTITIAAGVSTLVLDPAGTLATGTITMPASPVDGQVIQISSSQTITALTVSANSGQSIKNAPTTLVVSLTGSDGYEFRYSLANTTWYRIR